MCENLLNTLCEKLSLDDIILITEHVNMKIL